MARKRRSPAAAVPPPTPAAAPADAVATADTTGVVLLLAGAVLLAPAIGSTTERLLQDTLKSAVVAFAALAAAALFFLQLRRRPSAPLWWHPILWLPVALCAYALGSMAWSHTYLGGVEAIRWFLFGLLLWLGLNTLARERLPWLAWGIHGGAVIASLWTVLQFWFDFGLFPQGPNPASTFVNRNFYAEFAACTLPFSVLLLVRARQSALMAVLAASTGLVVVAILMTGTRAALVALWVQAVLLPWLAWRYRQALPAGRWRLPQRAVALGVLLATVGLLAMLPSGNPKVLAEGRGTTALERGLQRTASISPGDESLAMRRTMWSATLRMIGANPLTGVGAGAWEVDIPLHQPDGAQLETDYYAHNEYLQMAAEDGLVGLLALAGLFAYLLRSAWRTWRLPRSEEAAWRAVALASLLALLIVSNVGFAWRMASTGALFALTLALLAASDARLEAVRAGPRLFRWHSAWSVPALAGTAVCAALAAFITWQAVRCERMLVEASNIALSISASPDPNSPRWNPAKGRLLALAREGIAINPHYRKITPIIADELAQWGDWQNATWIWESVLRSRPYVVAMLTNAARGHAAQKQMPQALQYLGRAQAISPDAPSVRSLEVILLAMAQQPERALALARQAMEGGRYDYDLLDNTFTLARHAGDYDLAERALRLRIQTYPIQRSEGLVQLGTFYLESLRDEPRALAAWREGVSLAHPRRREQVLAQVPAAYRDRVAP
jgi:O-antigen ligase